MKIKCMALKGEMEHTECLACAAKGENTCGYDYGLLRFIFRDREDRPDIHVTDLTGCLRKAFGDKRWEIVRFPHENLVLSLGSITHGLLEKEDEIDECEYPINAMGIVGRIDRMHFVDGGVDVIDVKTTRWLKPSNLPYGSHALQLNFYCRMLKEKGIRVKRALVQYIDLSGPTKCRACKLPVIPVPGGLECPSCGNRPNDAHLGAVLYEVPLMDEDGITEMITERRDKLLLALEMDDPPEAETSFLCNYCAHVERCPEGQLCVGR